MMDWPEALSSSGLWGDLPHPQFMVPLEAASPIHRL
jgi:hypothetical protein